MHAAMPAPGLWWRRRCRRRCCRLRKHSHHTPLLAIATPLSGSSSAVADSQQQASGAAAVEDYSGENLDEVLLTELTPEGSAAPAYIVYRNGSVVDAAELEQLCDKVGWPRRPLNKVSAALANSFLVATLTLEDAPPASSSADSAGSAGSNSSSGEGGGGSGAARSGRLIGLARCTSDGAFNATIWDVLVDPAFQGQVGGRQGPHVAGGCSWHGARQAIRPSSGCRSVRCATSDHHGHPHLPAHRAWARRWWRA